MYISQNAQRLIAPYDATAQGLGGWSLNVHHAYDTVGRTLFAGDGTRRAAELLPRVITTVLAGGIFPSKLAPGPDGSVYIADAQNQKIWRLDPSGSVSSVAGTGVLGFSGDGGLATAAQLRNPQGVAVAPDGSLYLADTNNHAIRKVSPAGIMTTVAGTGVAGLSGAGGLATLAASIAKHRGLAASASTSALAPRPEVSAALEELGVPMLA
ncbi:MAG: hypothetical protein AAB576_07520, partial [Elusimicrobiota bacterium]